MDDISGALAFVTVPPGRRDIISATLDDGTHYMFSMETGATVRIDGEPVKTPGQLFDWLLRTRPIIVTLRPSGVRYGLSMDTDFKSAGA